ncbi:MAG: insulinase family protein [Polyangiaceae bacterium]|nr:insulinase family protein [Polyangiaceae bacterium]
MRTLLLAGISTRRSVFGALVLSSLLACGGPDPAMAPPAVVTAPPPVASAPDPEAFRRSPPGPDGAIEANLPNARKFTLRNGVEVHFVERKESPLVQVAAVFREGSGDVYGTNGRIELLPVVVSSMGELLEAGVKGYSAESLSNAYETLGADHGAWFDWDRGVAFVRLLGPDLEKGVDLLAKVLRDPTFPTEELERLKKKRSGALELEASNPRSVAVRALHQSLLGPDTAYGHSPAGTKDELKKLDGAAVRKAYDRLVRPDLLTLVAVGNDEAAIRKVLEEKFGSWTKPKLAPCPKATAPATPGVWTTLVGPCGDPKPQARATEARLIGVQKDNAKQTYVMVADRGVPAGLGYRESLRGGAKPSELADLTKIQVMNAILGGMFTSRINLNLREKHAYTYGANSRFARWHADGLFYVSSGIVAEKTADAVHQIFLELGRMAREQVTEDELRDAKNYLKLSMLGRMETTSELADELSQLPPYGRDSSYWNSWIKGIEAVTQADVLQAAKTYLKTDRMKVILVGDLKKLSPSLEALHLGALEERDPMGFVLPLPTKAVADKKAESKKTETK